MENQVTLSQMVGICPKITQNKVDLINKGLSDNKFNGRKRIAMFLANVAVESAGFNRTVESGAYTTTTLLTKTFTSSIKWTRPDLVGKPMFTKTEATNWGWFKGKDPVKQSQDEIRIFSRMYGHRKDLGNVGGLDSPDGFYYRGGGFIQITGKSNYENGAKKAGMTIEVFREWVKTWEGAIKSAFTWYLSTNNLYTISNTGDVEACCKIINGGVNGLEERKAYYTKFLAILTNIPL